MTRINLKLMTQTSENFKKNSKELLITGVGTEIGKTYSITKIIEVAKKKGLSISAIKPIISGWEADSHLQSDTYSLLQALGIENNVENINMISPFRLSLPLSPDMASRVENIDPLNFQEIFSYCKNFLNQSQSQIKIIEGVGGLMVPINEDFLIIDLIKKLNRDVILLSSNYLGSLSHTISAIKCLEYYKIDLAYIVINHYCQIPNHDPNLITDYQETIKSLKNFTEANIIDINSIHKITLF